MKTPSTFRERVYRTALAALIQAHPNWLDASVVTHAENIARLTLPTRVEADEPYPELEVAA